MLEHFDEEVEYKLEITRVFRDALSRQANESVRIYKRPESENLIVKVSLTTHQRLGWLIRIQEEEMI